MAAAVLVLFAQVTTKSPEPGQVVVISPTAVDVPAIEVECPLLIIPAHREISTTATGSLPTMTSAPASLPEQHCYTCAQKQRVLLTGEDGQRHCIDFGELDKKAAAPRGFGR